MASKEIINATMKDLDTFDSVAYMGELSAQNFYSPLSVTGYLTPLQRKKLREKRNEISVDSNDTIPIKVKKRPLKRKKRSDSVLRIKNKEPVKRIRTKDIQQVQYTVSKIVHKTADDSNKTKKFFKSSASDRLDKANFTMPLVLKKNVFLNIDKCVKETLAHTRKLSQQKENYATDRSSSEVFENIKDLESKKNSLLHSNRKNKHENITLSLQARKNSDDLRPLQSYLPEHETMEEISLPDDKKSIFEFNWPSDEELLKRSEKARELLRKKNILRQAKAVHEYKNAEKENKEQNVEGHQGKFYPLFHIAMKKQSKNKEIKRNLKSMNKKMKTSSNCSDQMIIDAGQKEIGPKVCKICNMLYTVGQEEDETLHLNYHNMHVMNLNFPGWKEENVIGEYCDGRVIMIRKSDKNFKLKKVEEVLQVANRDLGFPSSALPAKPDLTFLLFISKDKIVIGCIVAEPISKAFQVLLVDNKTILKDMSQDEGGKFHNWCSSSEIVPAICGVNRIWVAHNFRRHKIASRMVDCLRCHFIYGHVIGIREIAFTDPTPVGRQFAAAYTGTANFLVYK